MIKLIDALDIQYLFDNESLFDALYHALISRGLDIPEWLNSEGKRKALDTSYIQHSGEKWLTSYVAKVLVNGKFTPLMMQNVMFYLVYSKFIDKWNTVYDVMKLEYNPIQNYDSVEVRTPNLKSTTKFKTEQKVHTFNSELPEDFSETVGDAESNEINQTGDERITKSGNIGVTTSQQMIESELELRKWNFYNQLFEDLDSVICLQIY